MRWLRHQERRPISRRLPWTSAGRAVFSAAEWGHIEGTLARWLAADSLSGLCRAALEQFRFEHGFSRLLLVAWCMKRPVAWALAPEDVDRGAVQDWFDHCRGRATPVAPPCDAAGHPTVPARVEISPELSQLGFQFRADVVVDHRTSYEVFWSVDTEKRLVVGSPTRTDWRHGPLVRAQDGPLWTLLHLALASHSRMEHLRELSHIDTLTGAFNRRYFNLRLIEEAARAQRFGRPLALVIADLDQFKPLNDTRGHQVGDVVLRYVSQTVRHAVRSIDILCRLSGDEFAVLMPDTDGAECVMLGERLRRAVDGSGITLTGPGERTVLRMRLSLGGAVFPDHADRAERLLWCADMALLEAKRRGGNRFVFHDELSGKPPPGGCLECDEQARSS